MSKEKSVYAHFTLINLILLNLCIILVYISQKYNSLETSIQTTIFDVEIEIF